MLTESIPELFGIAGNITLTELGSGHINRTFLVNSDSGRYILQSLNSGIFLSPEAVMRNISAVEAALADCREVKVPHFLSCEQVNYALADGEMWRMYTYAEPAAQTDLRSAGKAYGSFIRVLSRSGFTPEPVIDGYHAFGAYLERLREVCPADKLPSQALRLAESINGGIPLRIIHGDAKLDNIIISSPCTVIDLDTVMSGQVAVDYGDLIRSVCTNGIGLRAIIEVTQGFAEGICGLLSPAEVSSLCDGICLVTGELAVRYLTDFYSDERYFRSKSREQCLERFNELMKQLDEFISAEKDIRRIISYVFNQMDHRLQK